MSCNWYVQWNGQEKAAGPFTREQMDAMAAEGKIGLDTIVRAGNQCWCEARHLLTFPQHAKSHPPASAVKTPPASTVQPEPPPLGAATVVIDLGHTFNIAPTKGSSMRLNRFQRIILIAAAVLLAASFLYVPWNQVARMQSGEYRDRLDYALVFSPPTTDARFHAEIDMTRVLCTAGAVSVGGAVAFVACAGLGKAPLEKK